VAVLSSIYEGAKTRLQAVSYFTDAPAVTLIVQDEGDIANKIEMSLARLGVCVVFLMRSAQCNKPNVPGPYLSGIGIVAQVCENVVINRRGEGYKTALEVAEHVLAALHHFKPASVNEVIVAAQNALELMEEPPPGASLAYMVNFETDAGLSLS
jgi:hypothetical protein